MDGPHFYYINAKIIHIIVAQVLPGISLGSELHAMLERDILEIEIERI
jgi:hypothetical protein